ncbi:helix-turn-helix domain-containing protein [Halapricum desulfuricans]|uniref:Transcriptional regulator, contains HTH domain n=1 Tax=Halapricum desulfuricans TaxID=2841257 RepID=A0A897NZA9_9EURY|nr:helix-turn-helix domain-containing protein [Halapricum desulfuricans]QSG16053.1 Transcriptional regulator, contains HTH domain [Halapricum desulfuricans]
MGIVTEITVPGDAFELGTSLAPIEDVYVTFDRVVPTGGRLFPYMWVSTDDHTLFCQLLQRNPAVEDLEMVHQEDDRALYDVAWCDDTDGFLCCLRTTDLVVLRAGGTASAWEFELRFADQETVSAFQKKCADREISISVDKVTTKSVSDPLEEKLTKSQRRTVQLALEKGYFDVPRKTTLVELAAELDISDQAVSARIRRATKKLSQQLLLPYQSEEHKQAPPKQR